MRPTARACSCCKIAHRLHGCGDANAGFEPLVEELDHGTVDDVGGLVHEIFGPDLVLEAEEKVRVITKNLEAAQARQKSYHDKRWKPLQFEVGDHVYLKVSPTRGVQRFGIKGKLAPRYIGPYEIREACGPVAYQLELPPHMSAVHNVFQVSQLWKCVRLPTEVLLEPDIEIEPDLSYQEYPVKVLDQKEVLRDKESSICRGINLNT